MSTLPCFSAILTKVNNCHSLLFAPLENKALLKGVNSERKEFAPTGANSFLEELTLF